MPTYQYACTECGTPLEAVQSFTDAPLTECLVCGGRLRKVFSAVGVVFKGSGFYKNDSRPPKTDAATGDKPAEKKADTPAAPAATSSSSSSSSDKPAAPAAGPAKKAAVKSA